MTCQTSQKKTLPSLSDEKVKGKEMYFQTFKILLMKPYNKVKANISGCAASDMNLASLEIPSGSFALFTFHRQIQLLLD